MPIYEYQCKACGYKFEALQKHNDQPLTTCPECGKNVLEKCVSLTSFKLKGEGWYETDYKTKKSPGQQEETKKPAKDKKKADSKTKEKEK
jgi:putative FmdB family regulatory protein